MINSNQKSKRDSDKRHLENNFKKSLFLLTERKIQKEKQSILVDGLDAHVAQS